MHISAANMAALLVAYSTAFANGMQTPPPVDFVGLGVANSFPSTTLKNAYPFDEAPDGFREWEGDRIFKDIMAHMHEVENRDFEVSRKVRKTTLDDDQHGLVAPFLQGKGTEWPMLQYELLVEVLTSQHNGYSGYPLISDSHAIGYDSSGVDNKVTDALSENTFETAFTTAATWKFSNGKLCRTQFTHLLYGPKLQSNVWNLIENQYVVGTAATGGTTDYVGGQVMNEHYKRVTPVLVPDFAGTYDDYWVLLDCSKFIKPVFLQIRETPQFVMDTDPRQIEFTGEIRMGASGRAAAGCTFPHLAYGGIL